MPVLCGVTRVGLVAKGLLIKGDMDLELVLMCREKPTKLLLYTISSNLPLQIQVPSVAPPALQGSAFCIQSVFVIQASIKRLSAENQRMLLLSDKSLFGDTGEETCYHCRA